MTTQPDARPEAVTGERVLVALGGNAMTGPDGSATPDDQRSAVEVAMRPVADLIAAGALVAVTHGNGPQVGNLLIKNQLAADVVPPVPLDWCGAQTQATIGVLILNALERALARCGVSQQVAVVATRTLVDRDDPGFANPTKPIGRYFPEEEARRAMALGQVWRSFGERGWRRVVASPEPLEILDAGAVATLMSAGYVVVAAGGGGVPVVRDTAPDKGGTGKGGTGKGGTGKAGTGASGAGASGAGASGTAATVGAAGALHGVEAVIDKDLAAALLASRIGATKLVIATNVEQAMAGYGTPHARPIGRTTVAELRALAAEGHFASGSMGPKVEAALRFVESGGTTAVITSLDRIADGARGKAGTVVEAHPRVPERRRDPIGGKIPGKGEPTGSNG